MSNIQKQYSYQYNYYCAINGYRGGFSDWYKWYNRQAIYQMQALDW